MSHLSRGVRVVGCERLVAVATQRLEILCEGQRRLGWQCEDLLLRWRHARLELRVVPRARDATREEVLHEAVRTSGLTRLSGRLDVGGTDSVGF